MLATLNSALSGLVLGSFCVSRAGGAIRGVTTTRRSGVIRKSEIRRTGGDFARGTAINAKRM